MNQKTKQIGLAIVTGVLVLSGVVTSVTPVDAASKTVVKQQTKSKHQVRSDEALAKANLHFKKQRLHKPFASPMSGKVSSPHGDRVSPFGKGTMFHTGIAIVAKKGTSVKASYTGKVVQVKTDDVRGKYIVIEHNIKGKTFKSLYAHLDRQTVKVGQVVKQGSVIGNVGNTGRTTGTHLHFEIVDSSNVSIDPQKVMR